MLLVLELARLDGDHEPVLLVKTPLGAVLQDGVMLKVDGTDLARLSFETCRQSGCVAQASGENLLDRLRARASMEVRFVLETSDGSRQKIILPAPLAGISRGLKIIRGEG